MAPEKRNNFLDADDSEDEDVGYNSEDELQKGGRSAKRRKVEDDDDSHSDLEEEDESEHSESDAQQDSNKTAKKKSSSDNKITRQAESENGKGEGEDQDQNDEKSTKAVKLPQLAKPLTKKNLVATEAAVKKSGVVYLSRIPPFMKPAKLRNLLEHYGKINRLFLAPQDPAAHARRVRAGGNKKKMYTEGWVEFVRKTDAKRVCDLLNAQTIGGKKGNYYRDDIWTLKYLKGFKWHNLTEQIAAENAERSNRMMAEISRTTKANKEFVRNIEKGKMLDGIQAKKAQKKKLEADDGAGAGPTSAENKKAKDKTRTFKQVPLAKTKEAPAQPSELQSVASRIF